MKEIKFTIPGQPVAKGRPIFGAGRVYTPEKTVNYEQLVKFSYLQTERVKFLEGEQLKVELMIYFAIPKSTSKKRIAKMMAGTERPTKKPDIDNIEKIILDSLNGIAYNDDSQIVSCWADKFYSTVPRVEIQIREV